MGPYEGIDVVCLQDTLTCAPLPSQNWVHYRSATIIDPSRGDTPKRNHNAMPRHWSLLVSVFAACTWNSEQQIRQTRLTVHAFKTWHDTVITLSSNHASCKKILQNPLFICGADRHAIFIMPRLTALARLPNLTLQWAQTDDDEMRMRNTAKTIFICIMV